MIELKNSEGLRFINFIISQLNKVEFEGLDEEVRAQWEGYRSGLYVRLEFENIPCELVENFNPSYPLLVGGLQLGEENIGYVNVSDARQLIRIR